MDGRISQYLTMVLSQGAQHRYSSLPGHLRRRGQRHDERHANPETSPSPSNLTSLRLYSTQCSRSLPTTTLDRPCGASVGPHLALANATLTNAHPLRHIPLRHHAHTE
jgi:hypothetical protein